MRVSYSILSAWARGDYDRAVAPFVGVEMEATDAMLEGRKLHEQWEAEAKKTGKLPKVFGGGSFSSDKPVFEKDTKRVVQINDWLTLSGVLDVLDGVIGVDYKSGTTPSNAYANSFQHKVYKILYPKLQTFYYIAHNQHNNTQSFSIAHLSDKSLVEGIEWVLTHASDLRAHLEQNNISLERKVTK